mmetsp:Transcript_53695/g.148905  ORF Transcript_53695/g.148905 Transcript_53695/m.148905 type:complete len:223 (-) Transcript_53695:552-1220(-)
MHTRAPVVAQVSESACHTTTLHHGMPNCELISVPFHKRHTLPSPARSTMQAWAETAVPRTTPPTSTQRQLPAAASQAHRGIVLSAPKTTADMAQDKADPAKMAASVNAKPFVKKSRNRSGEPRSWDFASTTMFGGVAVGSKKAKEVAIVAGSIKVNGLTIACTEAALNTGSIVLAVLMLERTWEKIVTQATTTKLSAKGCTSGMRPATMSPSATLKPEFVKP